MTALKKEAYQHRFNYETSKCLDKAPLQVQLCIKQTLRKKGREHTIPNYLEILSNKENPAIIEFVSMIHKKLAKNLSYYVKREPVSSNGKLIVFCSSKQVTIPEKEHE